MTGCSSVYLSALNVLIENFSGRRLALVMQDYPLNMTNMWPYLRIRQREVVSRIKAYQESFLGRLLGGRQIISEKLWMSPDHERQIVVAVRWVE
jgi:hypothetical protein